MPFEPELDFDVKMCLHRLFAEEAKNIREAVFQEKPGITLAFRQDRKAIHDTGLGWIVAQDYTCHEELSPEIQMVSAFRDILKKPDYKDLRFAFRHITPTTGNRILPGFMLTSIGCKPDHQYIDNGMYEVDNACHEIILKGFQFDKRPVWVGASYPLFRMPEIINAQGFDNEPFHKLIGDIYDSVYKEEPVSGEEFADRR